MCQTLSLTRGFFTNVSISTVNLDNNKKLKNEKINKEIILDKSTDLTMKKQLPERKNRGLRMKQLEGVELEKENEIYNAFFAENSSDEEFSLSVDKIEKNEDSFDSDFNNTEQESDKENVEEELIEIKNKSNVLVNLKARGKSLKLLKRKRLNLKKAPIVECMKMESKPIGFKANKSELNDIEVQIFKDYQSDEENDRKSRKTKDRNKEIEKTGKKNEGTQKYTSLRKKKLKKFDLGKRQYKKHNTEKNRRKINEQYSEDKELGIELSEYDENDEGEKRNRINEEKRKKMKEKESFYHSHDKPSQKDMLYEAIFTEIYNIKSLENLQKLEELNKREITTVNKKQIKDHVRLSRHTVKIEESIISYKIS